MANVFYVSEMNATSASNAAATFGQSADAQPTVTYATISEINGTPAATASTFFSFYLDITSATPKFVGVTNSTNANFPSLVTAAATNSTSAIDKKNISDDFTKLSAKYIFGSEEAQGLFTNISAINDGYDAALTSTATAVNNKLTAGNAADVKAAASDKLVGQIAVNYIDRFALMYNAVSINSGTYNGQTAAAWYPNGTTQATSIVVYRGDGAGTLQSGITHATVSVKTSDGTGTIESIFITSNADQWTSNTGSGYQVGDKLAIVAANSGVCVVKINGINAVQAAILNGTLDNSILYSLTKKATFFNTPLYGSGVAALNGGGSFTSAVGVASASSGAGTGATFDVVMSNSNTIGSIKINSLGTSGTYPDSGSVTLTQGGGVITITLSAAIAAVLNGGTNAGYNTFPVPVYDSNFLFNAGAVLNGSGHETGEYTTAVASGGGSGAGATFTVTITSGAIASIVLLTKATTDYVLGNTLTLSRTVSGAVKTITIPALTTKSVDVINNGADGTTSSLEVTTVSGGGANAYIDVTMADKYNVETIANSTYEFDFGMGAAVASGTPVSGTYTVSAITGTPTSGTGITTAGATFNVTMSGTIIAGIRRFGTNPTSVYATGNVLTLTGSGGTITLSALTATTAKILTGGSSYAANSVISVSSGTPAQKLTFTIDSTDTNEETILMSILNGTANALSATANPVSGSLIYPTNVPLEAGDKIRMQQGVSNASGQKNTQGQTVSYEQTAFLDQVLS